MVRSKYLSLWFIYCWMGHGSGSFVEDLRRCKEKAQRIAEDPIATNFHYDVWAECVNKRGCRESYDSRRNDTMETSTRTGMDKDAIVQEDLRQRARICEDLGGLLCAGTDNSSTISYRRVQDIIDHQQGAFPICFPWDCIQQGAQGLHQNQVVLEAKVGVAFPVEMFMINASCADKSRLISDGKHLLSPTSPVPNEGKEPEENEPSSDTSERTAIPYEILVGSLCALVVLVILAVAVIRKRKRKIAKSRAIVLDASATQDFDGDPSRTLNTHKYTSFRATIAHGQLEVHEVVGEGSYGAVHRGKYLGSIVAVKVIFDQLGEFGNEIELLQSLRHPNIVQFIGTCVLADYGVCVLTEFMPNGDLTSVLAKSRREEIPKLLWESSTGFSKLKMAMDIVKGLTYLHGIDTPIVHRDLKSRNILLSASYVAKIADFGVSRTICRTETMTAAGSTLWQAPEVLRGERFDEKADVYSFGVILSEFDTEHLPYYDKYVTDAHGQQLKMNVNAVAYRVFSGKFLPSFTPECPEEILQLALRCLESRPDDRPSAFEILEHLKRSSGYDEDRSYRSSSSVSHVSTWT